MIRNQLSTKNCLACDSPVKGRLDKKFCDDRCRNAYNNSVKIPANNTIRTINNTLGKNRRILDSFFKNGSNLARTNREKLLGLGFQFKYYTHTRTTPKGRIYHYCYDRGYVPVDNGNYLIVKAKS